MESTILIAKVLGVYFAVSGVFVVTHKKTLALLLRDLFGNRAITFLLGATLLIGGAAIVYARGNVWTDTLSVLVTLVAWAILIKGAIYILAPQWLQDMSKRISPTLYSLVGVVGAVIGLYLVFFLS